MGGELLAVGIYSQRKLAQIHNWSNTTWGGPTSSSMGKIITCHLPEKTFHQYLDPNFRFIQEGDSLHLVNFCLSSFVFYNSDCSFTSRKMKFRNSLMTLTSWKMVELYASTCGKACTLASKFIDQYHRATYYMSLLERDDNDAFSSRV